MLLIRSGKIVKRVGFILKPGSSEAGDLLAELAQWLRVRGHVPMVTEEDQIAAEGVEIVPEDRLGDEADMAMVLGGDGTMLRASYLVAHHDVPVLGINLGRLGFLTPFRSNECEYALEAALEGRLTVTERSRLAVVYTPATGEPVTRTSLNDAVIHQGAMARLVELETFLDEALIANYRADGLIIATPPDRPRTTWPPVGRSSCPARHR